MKAISDQFHVWQFTDRRKYKFSSERIVRKPFGERTMNDKLNASEVYGAL
jgi:hypothetical protein